MIIELKPEAKLWDGWIHPSPVTFTLLCTVYISYIREGTIEKCGRLFNQQTLIELSQ